MIDQIVKELLAQVVMYSYDGNKGVIEDYRGNLDELLQVTPDDVNKLPEHLQPDLTGKYVKKDISVKEIGQYLLFISFQASCFAHYDLSNRKRKQPIIYGAATTNEWVVREFIKDKENNPCIYKGLPLHTEYRVFVDIDTKEILGMNPYWGPAVMKQRFGKEADANDPDMVHDYVIYSAHEGTLMKRYQENKETVYKKVENLLLFLNLRGQWSMDIMQNGEDFYIIDMALAKDSALQSCVPKGMIKAVKEDLIPRISENYWPSERD